MARVSVSDSVLRIGSGDPLVLLHVGASPWHKWETLLPRLASRYDVVIPTLSGFPGGADLAVRASIEDLADGVEKVLDDAGIGTAHLVGNSAGGWIAMELGRRGRARSVTAISPGGGWTTRGARARVRAFFRINWLLTKVGSPVIPLVMRQPWLKQFFLRMTVADGRAIPTDRAVAIARDTMAGSFAQLNRTLGITRSQVRPYPGFGVPTTVAWSELDRLTPLATDGAAWRQAAPDATWRILPGVGHMPMYDDPDLVLELIEEGTAATA